LASHFGHATVFGFERFDVLIEGVMAALSVILPLRSSRYCFREKCRESCLFRVQGKVTAQDRVVPCPGRFVVRRLS
jgi:hypothetical protein